MSTALPHPGPALIKGIVLHILLLFLLGGNQSRVTGGQWTQGANIVFKETQMVTQNHHS